MKIGDTFRLGTIEMTITSIHHGWATVRFFVNDVPAVGTIQLEAIEREHANRRGNDVHADG